jgi:hypothetical protein
MLSALPFLATQYEERYKWKEVQLYVYWAGDKHSASIYSDDSVLDVASRFVS